MSGASGETALQPSALSTSPLMGPILLTYLLATFGVLALTFVAIQAKLPCGKWRKGLWYGLVFGGMWYIGMLETVALWGNPLAQELFMGFADGLPIFTLSLLLGGCVATDSVYSPDEVRITPGAIPVVGGVYLIGRYAGYALLSVDSAYLTRPLTTALWTLAIGIWMGLGYWLLRAGVPARTPFGRALFFGGVVYGLNWAFFILFMPLLFEMNWGDVLLRAFSDALWITLGAFVVERWIAPQTYRDRR